MLTEKLKQYSTSLMQQGLHRQRRVNNLSENTINFSSNDYLSLSSDPKIKKAYQLGYERYSTGSGGSMAVCGYHSTHKSLERAFAEALQVDDCIVFPSGYAANLSIMKLLGYFKTHALIDKAVHASIYDGLQYSNADYSRYKHNNLADLALKIKQVPNNSVIVTEGVFSMSGQKAPLAEIALLGKKNIQGLLVDEAHAFGVLGKEGLGAVIYHQLTQNEVPLRIIPLGKAFAASGAMVAGQADWIDALLQLARPHIYSTAISPATAYGLLETLNLVRSSDKRRTHLNNLVAYFRDCIKTSPHTWRDSLSPIQQLQLGCPHRAVLFAEKLREQAIICLPMRQPTVSKKETGLRVILNYHHQQEHIDHLFKCLNHL
jgi:8-amino-7-oxononanoate synthase